MSKGVTLAQYQELLKDYCPATLIEVSYSSNLKNDAAHDVNHVYHVTKRAIGLARKFYPHDFVIHRQTATAGLLHDIGCSVERDQHHTIGARISEDLLVGLGYNGDDIKIITGAIENHRASFTGLRRNVVEELVAIADRGSFNYKLSVTRAVQYALANTTEKDVTIITEGIVDHLNDKYGSKGYAWNTYPPLGLVVYKEEIEEFKKQMDNTEVLLRDVCDELMLTKVNK